MEKDKEILELQETFLIERIARLNAEFELTKRDLMNVRNELMKIKNKLKEN